MKSTGTGHIYKYPFLWWRYRRFKVVARQTRESASCSQQVFPTFIARDCDVQSFQVLLHLLHPLLHRVLSEEFFDVGFKLGTDEAGDAFAHAGNGVVRVTT